MMEEGNNILFQYLPVLMYHRISCSQIDNKYTVRHKDFEKQVEYLRKNKFRTIIPEDIKNIGCDNNKKLIMITFDDGCRSDFQIAFPLLKECGFKGVSFVTTDYIDNPKFSIEYMSWNQISEMVKNGFSIQSHTHTHGFLNQMSDENIRRELMHSKRIIKEKLDIDINSISLPGGRYDKRVVRLCKSLGYEYVFTSEPGINIAGKNQYLFYRMLITADTSFDEFKKQVNCCHYHYAIKRIDYRSKRFLKTVIGEERYHRIWEKFIR